MAKVGKVAGYLHRNVKNERNSELQSRLEQIEKRALDYLNLPENFERREQTKLITTSEAQHTLLRDALENIAPKFKAESQEFFVEEHTLPNTFTSDFFVPSLNLCLEINGRRAFYPYARQLT